MRVLCNRCSRGFCLVDQGCDEALINCAWWGLAIDMRKSVIQSAVDNFWRRLGRWDSIVGMNGLGGFQTAALNAFDYAVDSLMTVLLGGSVLLELLKIRATSYIVAKTGTASSSGRGGFCHVEVLRWLLDGIVGQDLFHDSHFLTMVWRGDAIWRGNGGVNSDSVRFGASGNQGTADQGQVSSKQGLFSIEIREAIGL